jgi:hypothetical protein
MAVWSMDWGFYRIREAERREGNFWGRRHTGEKYFLGATCGDLRRRRARQKAECRMQKGASKIRHPRCFVENMFPGALSTTSPRPSPPLRGGEGDESAQDCSRFPCRCDLFYKAQRCGKDLRRKATMELASHEVADIRDRSAAAGAAFSELQCSLSFGDVLARLQFVEKLTVRFSRESEIVAPLV